MNLKISGFILNASRCFLFLCYLLVAGLSASPATADSDSKEFVYVYIEVPAQTQVDTRITLESLELVGNGISIDLPVQDLELSAGKLAGTQFLLGIAHSVKGTFHQANLAIGKVAGSAGVAPIQMDHTGKIFSYEIDLVIGSGTNQCLLLTWHPQPIPNKSEDFRPNLFQRQGNWPPLGSAMFVSCPSSNSLLVADINTLKIEGSLHVGKAPRGMVYSPFTQKIYVALQGDDSIAVIDAPSCYLEQTISLNFGDEPARIILAANGTDILVLNSGSRTLAGISTFSNQEKFRITVGNGPRSLAQDPETELIYVACEGEGEIQVIDPALPGHQGALNVTSSPAEIIIDSRTRILACSSSSQRKLFGWDLGSGVSFPQLNLCSSAVSLVFNNRTNLLYCGLAACSTIGVFQPEIGLEFTGIRLLHEPGLMTFDSQFRVLAVTLPDVGHVALINVMSSVLMKEFSAGPDVYEVLIP